MVNNVAVIDGGGGSTMPFEWDVPQLPSDPNEVGQVAEMLSESARSLRQESGAAQEVWAGLPAVYEAAGTEPLYRAFDALHAQAGRVGDAMTAASEVLGEFSSALHTHGNDRDSLIRRMQYQREIYYANVPGSYDRDVAEQALLDMWPEIAALSSAIATSERTCAEGLDAIRGGTATGVVATGNLTGSTYSLSLSYALTGSLTPAEQLDLLAQMSPEEAARWLQQHPEFAEALAASPPPAEDVQQWWLAVEQNPDLAQALIAGMPQVLGNLNGVSYWARSEANTIVLDADIAAAQAALPDGPPIEWVDGAYGPEPNPEWVAWDRRRQHLDQLLAIQESMDGEGVHQLIEFHSGQPPLAAVSTGDVDQASTISVMVPGIQTSTANLPGLMNVAENLAEEQSAVDPEGNHAVIAWVGYETPTPGTTWGMDHADAGAIALGNTMDGIEAVNGGAYTSVLAHSYGTIVATQMLRYDDHGVDNLVMYGSAGLAIDNVDDLHLDPQNVWATEAPDDAVADVGRWSLLHPHNPLDPDFGAQEFSTGYHGQPRGPQAHDLSAYYSGESIENIALISTGQGDQTR